MKIVGGGDWECRVDIDVQLLRIIGCGVGRFWTRRERRGCLCWAGTSGLAVCGEGRGCRGCTSEESGCESKVYGLLSCVERDDGNVVGY